MPSLKRTKDTKNQVQKTPWTVQTFRSKSKAKTPGRALSRKQKRTEVKSMQKLVDFQLQRESKEQDVKLTDCSKLPTPRAYHMPKPRCNLFNKISSLSSKNLLDRFDNAAQAHPRPTPIKPLTFKNSPLDKWPKEDYELWESRNL